MVDILIFTYSYLLLIREITVDRRGVELVLCVAVGKMLEIVVHLMVNRCELLGGQMAQPGTNVASIDAHHVHDSAKDFTKSRCFFPKELAKQVSESQKKINEH